MMTANRAGKEALKILDALKAAPKDGLSGCRVGKGDGIVE